jgi:hypothetical protein
MIGCAALCGALAGPMLARLESRSFEPIEVIPVAAIAPLGVGHSPTRPEATSFAPIAAAKPVLAASWPAESQGESLALVGTPRFLTQQPIYDEPYVQQGVMDIGLRRLASGSGSISMVGRADGRDEGPIIQFITE